MTERRIILLILSAIFIIILGLVVVPGILVLPSPSNTTKAEMPNPAADFCSSRNDSVYEIRISPDGSEYGVCILPDGTVCDEWEYYRGNCTIASASGQAIRDPAENFCLSRGYMYQTQVGLNGIELTFCIFPNGEGCEAYDYYLGTCSETTARPI